MATKDKLVTAEEVKAAYDDLDAKKVNKSDIVNNLTSSSTTAPLSAAQGKALNEAIAQSTAWKYLGQLQTVNATLTMPTGTVEILFVHCNSSEGTAFGSLVVPNISMPQVFSVNTSVGEAVISRSSSTLTLTSNTNNSIVRVYYR